ncbi:TrbG/VirB9 family P-type conjugative transfer protein [Aurantiacibacter luteus]|uniref:TrbG/VirB9 family P-type conjugative transfer protein n=1 Tax=Aurantiacibacter luteus TaxID=1581420 RepID=UPI00069C1607|nr:TrbG/VirB9 family P-type conjugative transfer protein [Aurantiacibacter luteus]
MRIAVALALLMVASGAQAQVVPDIPLDNPRLQTVTWSEGEEVLLTVMPPTGLTVMFERGERIERISLTDQAAFQVRVSPDGDSMLVLPLVDSTTTQMQVETDRRSYPFTVRTGTGLTAAYLVRFAYDGAELAPLRAVESAAADGPRWSYRMRGDAVVRPAAIRDDARRTYITYGPEQALPAVFAVGPTGEEEMVNGYMRGDTYVIDRVYGSLVFRLDEERATATRNAAPDAAQ